MGTQYESLYERLLSKFRSYEIPLMSTAEVKQYLHDFLEPAIVKFHICNKDLTNRDDESECFYVDLSSEEMQILANYMLLEYLDSTYIRTPALLKTSLSSSDFNAFSMANHLDKLLDMHKTYLSENEGLLSRYSWFQSKDQKPKWTYRDKSKF